MEAVNLSGFVGALSARYGFTPTGDGGTAGEVDGFPVHVTPVRGDQGEKQIAVVVTTGDATMAQVVLHELKAARDQAPAKPRTTDADGDVVVVRYPARAFEKLPSSGVEVVEHVVSRAASVASARPVRREGAHLTLVDGAARFLTEADREHVRLAGEQAAAAYAATRPNLARGALFGLGGVAAGTLVWAVIGAYFSIQAFLVAIGAGVLIAWLAVHGARRTGPAVQAVIGVQTLATVVLGELAAMTLFIHREFGVFDPAGASRFYIETMGEFGGDIAFTLLGGVIGAFVGIRAAARPNLAPEVRHIG